MEQGRLAACHMFNQPSESVPELFPFGIFAVLWHQRRIHRCRILTLGVKEGYRTSGVDVLLYYELTSISSPLASLPLLKTSNRRNHW